MPDLPATRVRVATYLALLNIAGGLAVLAGWQFRIPWLKGEAFGTFVSPNSAACFILCGLSLLLQLWGGHQSALRKVALVLAALVTAFAGATLLEHVFHIDLGIDRLLMAHRLQDWTLPTPGRFVPNTGIGFVCAGLSLLTLGREKGTPVSEIFACGVLVVAYESLLGYMFSTAVLYAGVMALPTILMLLVLALSLFCAAARQLFLGILLSPFAGAVASRRMLTAIIILLPATGLIELKAEKAGYVSLGFGTAISTMVVGAILTILAFQTAAALSDTDRRRLDTESERNRAAGLLVAIVNSSDDAIVSKNLDGFITSWNQSAERLFGYTAAEAIGQHITLIIPLERRSEEETIINRIRRGERVDHFETVRVRKDGTRIDLSLTISPVRDAAGTVIGASKVARDVTQRKQAEQAIRESEERFRAIVETTPECVKLVAADGTLQHMNSPGLAMLGADRPEMVVGKNIYDLIAPEDRDRFREFNERICRGEKGGLEFDVIGVRGVRRRMETHAAPLYQSDGTIVQLGVTRDVTDRKIIEERLRKTEKMAAAGQLAASLAHEINNPLSSVVNALYLLKGHSGVSAQARELVDLASSELGRVSRIVRQSLSYYRARSVPGDVDLGTTIEESLQVFSGKLERAGIRVNKRVVHGACIIGFPDEIRQIIDNLLLNAIEAMPQGGRLQVSVRQSLDWKNGSRKGVRLIIADSGSGISKDKLSRIFEPFFTTKPEKGTGLGLWVVQALVIKHDGTIRVRSSDKSGRSGTVISVVWPLSSRTPVNHDSDRAETFA